VRVLASLDQDISWRGRALLLLAAVVLLLLSRLPFLVSQPDWGVFWPEHYWMATDPGLLERWNEHAAEGSVTLSDLDPMLYQFHYHSGIRWVVEAARLAGWVTGGSGPTQLKLVGLGASTLALVSMLLTLFHVWPRQPARWVIPLFVAWLVPPALLVWMTLMPMGHYLETWFFHALLLPPLVMVLSDRAGRSSMAATGVAVGLATAYSFSNAVFCVLLLGSYLLFSERSIRERIVSTGLFAGAFALFAFLIRMERLDLVVRRISVASPTASASSLLGRVVDNAHWFVSREPVLEGGTWVRRGLWATLSPGTPWSDMAAWCLLVAVLLGVVYLWRWVPALRSRVLRSTLPLSSRLLASQGVLVAMIVGVELVMLQDTGDTTYAIVGYATIAYPPLLFGLAQGLAAALGAARWRGLGVAFALPLVALLVVGWAQSAQHNLRALDRVGLQAAPQWRVPNLLGAAIDVPGPDRVPELERRCLGLYPGNERFCATVAWTEVLRRSDDAGATPPCNGLPEGPASACRLAVGAVTCHAQSNQRPSQAWLATCDERAPQAVAECRSGCYRGGTDYPAPQWAIRTLPELCGCGEGAPCTSWSDRACLEATAYMLTGMPPLPGRDGSPLPKPCEAWPSDWGGLCQQIAGAAQARLGERSCEDVYLQRVASGPSMGDGLIYGQCIQAGVLDWALYPPCVIGVAKALEGVSCSWRGTELRL
jgi:hypothetical protein